jgi:hypothetical protein
MKINDAARGSQNRNGAVTSGATTRVSQRVLVHRDRPTSTSTGGSDPLWSSWRETPARDPWKTLRRIRRRPLIYRKRCKGKAGTCIKTKASADSPAPQHRHFLPNDLAGALKRLDDLEIDALLAAVTTEAERRGRRPPSPAKEKPVSDAKPQRRQESAEDGAGSLTTGKLNAVRAAFKAGVKPSAIARQPIGRTGRRRDDWQQAVRGTKRGR